MLVASELLHIPMRKNLLSHKDGHLSSRPRLSTAVPFGPEIAGPAPESLIIILQFLHSLLDGNRSASTSKVHVATIVAHMVECETKLQGLTDVLSVF